MLAAVYSAAGVLAAALLAETLHPSTEAVSIKAGGITEDLTAVPWRFENYHERVRSLF